MKNDKMADEKCIVWPRDKTLKLINAYKENRCLWDRKDKNYKKSCTARNSAWEKVAKEVDCSPEFVKGKMNSLLASFRRERAKMLKSLKEENVDADTTKYKTKWFAYKHMLFLDEKNNKQKKLLPPTATVTSANQSVENSPANLYDDERDNEKMLGNFDTADELSSIDKLEDINTRMNNYKTRNTKIDAQSPIHFSSKRKNHANLYHKMKKVNELSKTPTSTSMAPPLSSITSLASMSVSTISTNASSSRISAVAATTITTAAMVSSGSATIVAASGTAPTQALKDNRNRMTDACVIEYQANHSTPEIVKNTATSIKKVHRDTSDIFGEYVATKHRNYDEHVRCVVEHAISKVFYEADMGKFGRSKNGNKEIFFKFDV